MKSEHYSEGGAFQAEKRAIFSSECLPLCAEGQLAKPGDFLAATVGGWGVVGVRDKAGVVRVLRNACRHQNMQVVGVASGNCETFRCRFHGWTYDLQGRFVGAPPPVAPKDPQSADLHLATLPSTIASGLVFFGLAGSTVDLELGPLGDYGGTLATEIACNWKVCVEHLLAGHAPSAGFIWSWPLLVVRRAGAVTVMQQVVPHTFLRTRLLTHVFGGAIGDHESAAATVKDACEALHAERATGKPAVLGPLVDVFHRRLAAAYAKDGVAT